MFKKLICKHELSKVAFVVCNGKMYKLNECVYCKKRWIGVVKNG